MCKYSSNELLLLFHLRTLISLYEIYKKKKLLQIDARPTVFLSVLLTTNSQLKALAGLCRPRYIRLLKQDSNKSVLGASSCINILIHTVVGYEMVTIISNTCR